MTENLLIHGDNLPVLQSLLPAYQASFQCAFLDPPYNTGEKHRGNPQAGYRDRYQRNEWRDMMVDRLRLLRDLLSPEGSIFVQLDDNEMAVLELAMDEVFGREQFINRITVAARSPSAFSTVNKGVFKASEYLLWYARDRTALRTYPVRVPRAPDKAYALWLSNPDAPHEQWQVQSLRSAFPTGADLDRMRVEHASQVCRLASISDKKAGRSTVEMKAHSKAEPSRVFRVDREGLEPRFILRGQQLIFYDKQVAKVDGQFCATRPLTNIWTDIGWEGIAREGNVVFKTGKKPEKLLRRCLQLCTRPGDAVIDPFSGSGTTAAVAHKMGRSWVAIERSEIYAAAQERLNRVVRGEDSHGITELENWSGGGHFTPTTHKHTSAEEHVQFTLGSP